jgi:type IV pilus assembly protein PilM
MIRASSMLATPPPGVAVEITPRRVSVASLELRGGTPVVAGHAIVDLRDGAVVPSLNAQNIADRATVAEALTRAFDRIGRRPRRVALVVPDSVAKISLVRFEKIPQRPRDLDELVRWQVRKTAPFRIEDAQVTYSAGAPAPEGGREFVVALARRDIIAEYEAVCAAAGAHAGIVDLATLNVVNLVLASGVPPADWLLVHVTIDYTTVAILRGADLIFFRSRTAEAEGTLADLVHQTAMYYEDRLTGAGFSRVILAGAAAAGGFDQLRRSLEDRLRVRVEPIDPRQAAALTDRIAAAPDFLDALAPLVGVLMRERAA